MILLVWNEHQRVPATVYGNAHAPGRFDIHVCPTQREMAATRARWPDAIVYNFTASGGANPGGR